jgi:predicted aconitase with swiveling domain
MLRDMVARGMAPLALLLNFANPIMAQGAAFAGLPLIDRFEDDVTTAICTGDRVSVDPAAGTVTLLEPAPC